MIIWGLGHRQKQFNQKKGQTISKTTTAVNFPAMHFFCQTKNVSAKLVALIQFHTIAREKKKKRSTWQKARFGNLAASTNSDYNLKTILRPGHFWDAFIICHEGLHKFITQIFYKFFLYYLNSCLFKVYKYFSS